MTLPLYSMHIRGIQPRTGRYKSSVWITVAQQYMSLKMLHMSLKILQDPCISVTLDYGSATIYPLISVLQYRLSLQSLILNRPFVQFVR